MEESKTEVLATLGDRMKAYRNSLRISQRELARRIGVSNNYLSEIEKGQANPGYTFFHALFTACPINPDYLFKGIGEMSSSTGEKVLDETIIRGIIESGEVNTLEDLIMLMTLSKGYGYHILGYATQCLPQSRNMLNDALTIREKKSKAEKPKG